MCKKWMQSDVQCELALTFSQAEPYIRETNVSAYRVRHHDQTRSGVITKQNRYSLEEHRDCGALMTWTVSPEQVRRGNGRFLLTA